MRSGPEIGGFLDDAWNVLKAASPVVNAIDAVKNAASKKEEAKGAAAKGAEAGASAAGAKPVADALKAKSTIPTWVWVFVLYLIAKKA